jgi:hypothetical protein
MDIHLVSERWGEADARSRICGLKSWVHENKYGEMQSKWWRDGVHLLHVLERGVAMFDIVMQLGQLFRLEKIKRKNENTRNECKHSLERFHNATVCKINACLYVPR